MVTDKKILVFTAHPDDEVACAGTIAKLTAANNEVVIVVATNGDKGTHDASIKPEQLVQMRKTEMDQAADILGVSKVIWLGFGDGTLETSEDLKEKAFRIIREEKPHVVMSFDPWKRWDPHSDHRTIGFVAVEAAYLADGCWYYAEQLEEGLSPHNVDETYLFHSDEPNYTVDVKDTFAIKLQAADAHKSQRLQYASFGEKYLTGMKARLQSESELYKEAFRKMNNSSLNI